MNGIVKMYKILDGERVSYEMPVGSVDRALKKGLILEEAAQKLEMPVEILKVMGKKRAELVEVNDEPVEVPPIKTVEMPTTEQAEEVEEVIEKKPMGRPKRK